MINLLPPSERKELQRTYRLRLGIVVLAMIFALEVLSALVFTPSYYSLYTSTADVARSLSEQRVLLPPVSALATESLTAIKKEITLLKPGATILDVPPSGLLGGVIAQKPTGIALNSVSYARTVNTVTIQLSGVASTQEDLLAFRHNVKTDPRVLDFKYGSSFITQKTDINFSAIVTFQ